MQLKSWQFDPTLSNGSLSDQVTTINIILNVNLIINIDFIFILVNQLIFFQILGEKLQAVNKSWIFYLANYLLKMESIKNPYITKTAGEFIFDGYDDPLLDIVIKLKTYINIDIPFKKVGWFYGVIYYFSKLFMINKLI